MNWASVSTKLLFGVALVLSGLAGSSRGQESLYRAYNESASKAFAAKKWERAARFYTLAHEAANEAWGSRDGLTCQAAYNVGASYYNAGEYDKALKHYTLCYKGLSTSTDDSERSMLIDAALAIGECLSRCEYGSCLLAAGKAAEAESIMKIGVKHLDAALGSRHPRVRKAAGNLASCLRQLGKNEDAANLVGRYELDRE
jgi:tetratricopeptide (TPR) repeat protein